MQRNDNVTGRRSRLFPGRAGTAPVDGMALAALGVLMFSFTLPMTKIAVRGIDPLLLTAGRAAIAAVLAMVVLRAGGARRPGRGHARGLVGVVLGVVIGFPLLTAVALRHVPSAHGAIVIGLLPLATAGFAMTRTGERPGTGYWACSAAGLGAVAWFALGTGGGSLHLADLLLLGAVLAAALGYTEGAILSRDLGSWQVICWALVLASPVTIGLTIVFAARTGVDATAAQWSAFGYTAVFSMLLGFFAWYAGLARSGIARAGQLQLAQPLLSVVWGWPLLGEALTRRSLLAAAVVLGAVAVGRRTTVR